MTIELQGNPYEIKAEPITYPKKKREKFIARICTEIREARKHRDSQRTQQWKISVAQYQGRLEREDAGPRDCKLDFSQSRELSDSMGSRMINPQMGYKDLFTTEEKDPTYKEYARAAERFSAHIAPKELYLKPMTIGFQQAAIFGTAWVKAGWTTRMKTVREWGPDGTIESREVVDREGCFPEVVHTPNMLWPAESGDDIDLAPWLAERYRERPSVIETKSKRGVYRKGLTARKIAAGKADADSNDPDLEVGVRRKGINDTPGDDVPLECYQVFLPHPDDDYETILWLDVENGIELNWVENWYFDYQRPYRSWAFRQILGSLDGESLMFALEHLHKAYTGLLAIILDHSTRATEKLVLYLEDTGLRDVFADGRLSTGAFAVTGDLIKDLKSSVFPISLQGSLMDLKWVLDLIMGHMNNLSSIAAAMFGHEVAQRPTVGGTSQVLSESKQPLSLMLERWLQFWAEVHTMQFARYRQFKPEGMSYFYREQDGLSHQMTPETITWEAGYWGEQIGFKTKVSSQTMSRDIRKQELLALLEKLPQILNGLMPLVERAIAGDPLSMLIGQLVRRYLSMIEDFFEEFEIATGDDELEGGLFTAMKIGEQYAEMVDGLKGQIQQLEGKLAKYEPPVEPGVPTGMDGPAGAAVGAGPGGMGPPQGVPGMEAGGGPAAPPGPPIGPPGAFV